MALLGKNPPVMRETWVGKILWRRERLPTLVFCLENSTDCIAHEVTKSPTRLSAFHFRGLGRLGVPGVPPHPAVASSPPGVPNRRSPTHVEEMAHCPEHPVPGS